MSLPTRLVKTASVPGSQFAEFAAGCFWSVELAFQRVHGVLQAQVGYSGGSTVDPTYNQVCRGNTGHAESVLLEFDPSVVSYNQLLDVFWKKHDPTTPNKQGNDVGTQYRSVIFYHSPEQKEQAIKSMEKEQKKYNSKIVTQIVEAGPFYPAEEYHQKYLEKGGQCAMKGNNDHIRCYG
ncbi:Peptide methionine sulfoxide reductase A1 [Smittium mucronatum]|uniref:peptide-methionine (S)-S-oxide reductase n=1 Tax=Smittium mucronatum TaxID=133383 RepID=A0A1R0GMR3_9FUNG|nr:Peptide methionine sulfoxide reductase A1 [Smittium mucronatum]OLY78159.1 Peptide methionine sulfoxide reductase A1 [Smittium mucronatum]